MRSFLITMIVMHVLMIGQILSRMLNDKVLWPRPLKPQTLADACSSVLIAMMWLAWAIYLLVQL